MSQRRGPRSKQSGVKISNLRSEDDFLCAICLDVFTDPVSTPCGHNFCKHCITTHWDMTVPSQCPMCKDVSEAPETPGAVLSQGP
uniref:RING-type domain-containing protein n=1 Tax=Scophthalmus maximus TaxID=52904 RepID=A0A8D3C4A1_SCOMX